MKIIAKPEGREDLWIPEKQSLIEYIKSLGLTKIHHFTGGSCMVIGADHSLESVIEDISKTDIICIMTDKRHNLGHSLALVIDNKLECYDIGEIKKDNLIIE